MSKKKHKKNDRQSRQVANPSNRKLEEARKKLNELYDSMPETVGCMEHIAKPKEEGGCGGWCCILQNPQVLYSEFRNTWREVLLNWSNEDIIDLIEKAIRNYTSPMITKGCIFFDRDSKLCTQHKTRPYNCRIYGITPEEEFKPRYERLKVLYQDEPMATIKDQCNLIKTEDGSKVTVEQTTKWWNEAVEIEKSIGVPAENINDDPGGSYRTYHDHILLTVCSDNLLDNLQAIRLSEDTMTREIYVKEVVHSLKSKLPAILNKMRENNG